MFVSRESEPWLRGALVSTGLILWPNKPTQTRSLTATQRCKNLISFCEFTPSVWQWLKALIITFKGRRRQQVFFIKRWIQYQCHPLVGLSQHSHTDDDRRKYHYLPYRLLPLSSVIISSSSPASFALLRGAGGLRKTWSGKEEGSVFHRKGGVGSHRVDVFGVCVFVWRPAQTGSLCGRVFGETRTHTHTHLAHDITAYRAAGRNFSEKGEALWRRGKRREGRKRRRRGGKGLAREKSGTPTIWDRTDRGWTEVNRAKEGKTDKRRHTQ